MIYGPLFWKICMCKVGRKFLSSSGKMIMRLFWCFCCNKIFEHEFERFKNSGLYENCSLISLLAYGEFAWEFYTWENWGNGKRRMWLSKCAHKRKCIIYLHALHCSYCKCIDRAFVAICVLVHIGPSERHCINGTSALDERIGLALRGE